MCFTASFKQVSQMIAPDPYYDCMAFKLNNLRQVKRNILNITWYHDKALVTDFLAFTSGVGDFRPHVTSDGVLEIVTAGIPLRIYPSGHVDFGSLQVDAELPASFWLISQHCAFIFIHTVLNTVSLL